MLIFRKAALAAALLSLLSIAPAARADDVEDAQKVVTSLMDEAVSDFSGKTLSTPERDAKLHELIAKYVDVDESSHEILGYHWTKATPEQRQRFSKQVVDYVISSWSSQVKDVPAGQKVEFHSGDIDAATGHILLHTTISRTGVEPSPVEWVLAHGPDGHIALVDATVEGVSILKTMHGDFTAIIRANGGSLDALMDALDKKISTNQAAN